MKQTVIIYADDDLERLNALRLDVAIAEAAASETANEPRRYGESGSGADGVKAARDACYAFVDEAAGRAEEWVLSSIGHGAFRDLLRACPARKVDNEDTSEDAPKQVTHPDDERWGFNTETFPQALLLFVDPEDPEVRTIIEPADAARRLKRLSLGQFESLWAGTMDGRNGAYQLNTGVPQDPKALRFSIAQTSSET